MALTAEQQAFLDELHHAVVATLGPDGMPQLTVLWYLRDGDDLVFNTKADRVKDRNLRRDPRIAATIVSEDGGRYLTVKGTATLDEASGQDTARRLAIRYNGPEGGEEQMRTQFSQERRITIRLPLRDVYAYDL
jgi:PPOX class probable F420-dependent enzyme